jgi:hypothetical protein
MVEMGTVRFPLWPGPLPDGIEDDERRLSDLIFKVVRRVDNRTSRSGRGWCASCGARTTWVH